MLLMRFVETPVFTAAVRRHLDDDQYRQLQIALMLRPEQGPVIRGAGGLRKVRWATTGAGKRGGLRVIYYWAGRDQVFYMVYAYTKAEQGDLTPGQTRQLARLVREEFKGRTPRFKTCSPVCAKRVRSGGALGAHLGPRPSGRPMSRRSGPSSAHPRRSLP